MFAYLSLGRGCCFLIGHLHFAYRVSSSRGGHITIVNHITIVKR